MTALSSLSAKTIVSVIAHAAERWSDAGFPARVRATQRVAERTGYSIPVVEYGLDRLFLSITAEALEATIAGELGELQILDGFRQRAGRSSGWARPVGDVCVISSRTTIGVALPPAIFALCAKCGVLVKDREDCLIAAFFETLHEEHSEFRQAARAELWNSSDVDAPQLTSFDAVVAFGADETLVAVRAALNPDARFIGFGPRASAGYVTRETLATPEATHAIARAAARDIVLYETEGCLSLHVLFVEDGGSSSASEFFTQLERELEMANVEFPRATPGAHQAAQLVQARSLARFRKAAGLGEALADPPQFLPRMTRAIPVSDPAQALEYLQGHRIALEGFAIAGDREDVTCMAIATGAVRLTRLGQLQDPPLHGNHGGRPRISEFVQWIDKTF